METRLFKNLRNVVITYRKRFFQAISLLVLSNALLILNPLLLRQALLSLTSSHKIEDAWLAHRLHNVPFFDVHSLVYWTTLLILVAASSALFRYRMRMMFFSISRDVERHMRLHLFERIQNQSKAFFDKHGVGELISRLTNDISLYRDILGGGLMFPLLFLTIVGPAFWALYSISPWLTFIAVIPLVSIPILHVFLREPTYKTSLAVQHALGEMSNVVQEHYSGIRIVKSYVMEENVLVRFSKLCQHLFSLNLKLSTLQGLLFPILALLTKAVTVIIVLLTGFIIVKAWQELSTADFVSFMWIQSYLFFPVLMLGWVLPIYEKGRAAYSRLVEIYQEPIEVQTREHAATHIPENAEIAIKNLSFSYPRAEKPSLVNINLTIAPKSFVGITGPIGSGKTTLFRLINREYEIPDDLIFIGGQELHHYALKAFSNAIATVDQAPFLFSKTVAENVRFGKPAATQEELELAAKWADFHETVLDFPMQYKTMLGERGVTLSGGQKQRLALARAFLVNRSILLLDDIFSAVDFATEKRIFSAMRTHFTDKTVLLITHRATILEKMDRILYLQNGSIVEDGSPATLIASGGHFATLLELQRMGSKVD